MVGAVSDAEADLARDVVSAHHVRVVPNGIPELDPDRTPDSSVELSSGVVAMGRVVTQRQPHEVADILANVRDLAPVSWIGGAGSSTAPGLFALDRAGVEVSGWLTRADALDRLGKAAVYLHWTAWDGMPLSILEAMARDVVVIASDIPPNRSILGPQQVFSSKADAVSAIRRALCDEPYRERLLSEQRARRGRYGSTTMMLGWENVYRSLTSEDSQPTPKPAHQPRPRRSPAAAEQTRRARVQRGRNPVRGRVTSA
jgi:glycosyltransferase involved in cell wall biosynthesis